MQQVKNLYNLAMLKSASEDGHRDPPFQSILSVWLQTLICWMMLIPFGTVLVLLLKYFRGYRIENLKEIRCGFKMLWRESDSPLIICANHLTFIDSAIIIWALASNPWYALNYRAFTWNLPAGDFFKKKLRYHLTLYLTKCIFLHRDGTAAHKNAVLNLCRYLLTKRNVVLIFPEGQRSRSGLFDETRLRFGVGKIITSLNEARVLCIYLRSPQQESYSNYPPRNSRFTLKMKLIVPEIMGATKKDASITVVRQVGSTIAVLQNEFFAENRRHIEER